jgi:AcrR family transcriptional regulator
MLNDKKKILKTKLRQKSREERKLLKAKEKKQKKNLLYATAIKLFTEKGFENVSIEDISQKAKVSYGTFYNFFSKKDDVLMYFFQRRYDIALKELDLTMASKTTLIEKVDTLLESYWKHVLQHKEFARVLAMDRIMYLGKPHNREAQLFMEMLVNLIEQYCPKQNVDNAASESRRIAKTISAINLVYIIQWINGTITSRQECLQQLRDDTHSIITAMCK